MSFLVGYLVLAWTEPTVPPPGGNVPAPLNVGLTAQLKEGALIIGANSGVTTGLIVQHGNVGIGTTIPGERLEVAGKIRLSGASPTFRITNLATPIASTDAATKGYVDAHAGEGGVLVTWGYTRMASPPAGTGVPTCPTGWTLAYNGFGWIPDTFPGVGVVGDGLMHYNAV